MSEESTTPDLVELVRGILEAANREDWDAILAHYAPDAVWDMSDGMGTFEGPSAIRGFWQDWWSSYERLEIDVLEILDVGNGVVLAAFHLKGASEGNHRRGANADGARLRVGGRRDRAGHELRRHRRGPRCRRTPCRVEGVGDVAGERGDRAARYRRLQRGRHGRNDPYLRDGPGGFSRRVGVPRRTSMSRARRVPGLVREES